MRMILDLLADYCDLRGYQFARLDGTMKLLDRKDEVNKSILNIELRIYYWDPIVSP